MWSSFEHTPRIPAFLMEKKKETECHPQPECPVCPVHIVFTAILNLEVLRLIYKRSYNKVYSQQNQIEYIYVIYNI